MNLFVLLFVDEKFIVPTISVPVCRERILLARTYSVHTALSCCHHFFVIIFNVIIVVITVITITRYAQLIPGYFDAVAAASTLPLLIWKWMNQKSNCGKCSQVLHSRTPIEKTENTKYVLNQ